ncbi:MAG: signal peptidase II [Trueperaceae bacterium]
MTLLVTAALVALDQASKIWAQAVLQGASAPWPVMPGVSLTYVRNPGAAFGMLQDLALPVGPLTIDGTFLLALLSLAVSVWLIRHLTTDDGPYDARRDMLSRSALVLILVGAIGNMIDRFRLGYVIDFVHVRAGWLNVPVFNVADAAISCGAVLLLVATVRPRRRAQRAPQRTPDAGTDAGR